MTSSEPPSHLEAADATPFFFLAYAHTPEQKWVAKLYRDLCAEVHERTTLPVTAQVGFMDDSAMPLGGDWRDAVGYALATCQVFVPLYSPRYFTREECGKEWYAFAQRILDHKARHPGNPPAIVPALWIPVDAEDMPDVARKIQMNHESLGMEYASEGFYTLIKNSYYSEAYVTAVQQLAKAIIVAAEQSRLRPCKVRDFGTPRNAFDQPNRDIPADRRLAVVVAAPTSERLPAGRDPQYYGRTAPEWNPYSPGTHQSLADYAAEVARLHSYEPTLLSFEDSFSLLQGADADDGLGILLIDAWLTADPDLAEKLRTFDKLDKGWIGTIVPWNLEDPQTAQNATRLRAELNALLGNRLNDGRVVSTTSAARIQTLEQFRTHLPLVVESALFRYLNHARANPPAGAVPPQPRLSGPGGSHAGTVAGFENAGGPS
jgi:FxsC-like protein